MSRPADGDQAISDSVAVLAIEIRALKASLVADGLSSDAVNRNEAVLAKVAALQTLKTQLAGNHPARDEVIRARLQVERQERHHQEQAVAVAQQRELKAAEDAAPRP